MDNKAIVIVSPMYPPHVGGVERYSYFLAGELAGRGFDVTVIAGAADGESPMSVDDRGISVFRVPGISLASGRFPLSFPSGIWRKLEKKLSSFSEVFFIIQTNLYLLSLRGAFFASRHGYRSVVLIHGSNYVCLGKSVIDRTENFYERLIARIECRIGTRFAAVSGASAEFAKKKLVCPVEAIAYNAVDLCEITAASADEYDLQRKHLIPANAVVFTFSGRLIREKGILQLLDAFRKVRELYSQAVLVVAGSGPLYDLISKDLPSGVILTGQLQHKSMLSVFKQTDCFLLPSDSEGFPTTVLEAAACGAYVITSPFGGMPEAVELTHRGSVMSGNSSEDIFQACCSFLEKNYSLDSVRSSFTPDGSDTMFCCPTWEAAANTVLDILRQSERN